MVAWSGLLRSTGQFLFRGTRTIPKIPTQNELFHAPDCCGVKWNIFQLSHPTCQTGALQTRLMSEHRIMPMQPTRWQWHKTKDLLHMYFLIGAIPCSIGVLLIHIFVGPAELTPTPEGYTPKHWEYYRDPISRFIARYCYTSPQQEYEKYLHHVWTETEIIKIRRLERRIEDLMYKRKDYQAYYYQPFEGDYVRRLHRVEHERQAIIKGEE